MIWYWVGVQQWLDPDSFDIESVSSNDWSDMEEGTSLAELK